MTALLDLLLAAAAGRFPPADALVEVFDSPPGPSDAVVAFTAHHVVAADVPAREILERLDPDDVGAPMGARFLAWLAGRLGSEAGMVDAVLAADPPTGPPARSSRNRPGPPPPWTAPRSARSPRGRCSGARGTAGSG